jgi:phospholipid-binding lipoprotein MlaA
MKSNHVLIAVLFTGIIFSSASYALNSDTEIETSATVMNSQDPYESFNRVMFNFNMGFNDTIGKPVADAYNGILPQPARTGISNVFDNLKTPISAINCFLQGKPEDGLSEIMRFTINTTFGLFGLLDVAEPAGLEAKEEDLGQTLYHWGVWNESNYIVLPIVGPYTTRELVGGMVENAYDPTYQYMIDTDETGRVMIYVGDKFVEYTKVVKLLEDIKTQPDPYVFSRESYLQYRTNLIFDGKAPQANLDDFNFE